MDMLTRLLKRVTKDRDVHQVEGQDAHQRGNERQSQYHLGKSAAFRQVASDIKTMIAQLKEA